MITINDLFPKKGRVILTAKGKDFIERLGLEASKQVILGVLRGENIRTQTEPLTQRRIAMVSGAMVSLFAHGWEQIDNFSNNVSQMAISQLNSTPLSNKSVVWPSQWLIGLTTKGYQNVLRSEPKARKAYIADFEKAISEAAKICENDYGPINITLGFIEEGESKYKALSWNDITRLTTAIGAATLTIRGSDKSTYGKLFEHLVLGTVLTMLGFEYITDPAAEKVEKVFWLSDSSDIRECDATIRIRAGKLARFDIGFIGRGNPEIMKDKLTRYANEIERNGIQNTSQSFIIVDRMPNSQKTTEAARISGAEIIQMSMQFWPKELARRLKNKLGYESEILKIPDGELSEYLEQKIKGISIQDFINGLEIDETIEEEVGNIEDELDE